MNRDGEEDEEYDEVEEADEGWETQGEGMGHLFTPNERSGRLWSS